MTGFPAERSLGHAKSWLSAALDMLGSDEACQEARWILNALGWDNLALRLEPQTVLPPETWQRLQAILARRQNHEPLQYILGKTWFFELELQVSPAVLIPRPETEELVALALEIIPPNADWKIAELGTGSGAIAIALAKARSQAQIFASDYSAAALQISQANGKNHDCRNIQWLQGSELEPFQPHAPFEVFISNPPYIPWQAYQNLAPEVKNFEPQMALTPGDNALYFYALFARELPQILSPGGWVFLELEATLANEIADLFRPPFTPPEILQDLQGLPRFLKTRLRAVPVNQGYNG